MHAGTHPVVSKLWRLMNDRTEHGARMFTCENYVYPVVVLPHGPAQDYVYLKRSVLPEFEGVLGKYVYSRGRAFREPGYAPGTVVPFDDVLDLMKNDMITMMAVVKPATLTWPEADDVNRAVDTVLCSKKAGKRRQLVLA